MRGPSILMDCRHVLSLARSTRCHCNRPQNEWTSKAQRIITPTSRFFNLLCYVDLEIFHGSQHGKTKCRTFDLSSILVIVHAKHARWWFLGKNMHWTLNPHWALHPKMGLSISNDWILLKLHVFLTNNKQKLQRCSYWHLLPLAKARS